MNGYKRDISYYRKSKNLLPVLSVMANMVIVITKKLKIYYCGNNKMIIR